MKKATLAIALVVLAMLATACGGGDGSVSIDSDRTRPELLYLGSAHSIAALAPARGHVRFQESGAVPSRDWTVLYTTTDDGTTTTLRSVDPTTGEEIAHRTVPGGLVVRTVSEDGAMVALTPRPADGTDTYHPAPKDPSPLVIVRRGDPEPHVLSVPGNVEPEAFSLSGDALFVIDFVPPLAPERYRVARLDLSRGSVDDVRSKEAELQEPMRGTARAQAVAPDGRRLYTLYTRDATPTEPAEAFVHVLDLDAETASCVDLPREFATDPYGAVAVTPSGGRLYVYSPSVRALAELDTRTLEIARTATVPAPVVTVASTVRATATESTVYLSVSDHIAPVALADLSAGEWTVAPGEITGIEPASDGSALYVVLTDRVLVVDPQTFAPRREVTVPTESVPIDHVAPALPPIAPGYATCAC
ncbi:MAG TPA: hypothetical protein VFW97_01780 [Acidimicrobiia bacterium]|nr:hypothetical protein [Acidimicrobiia bacterium]